LAVTPEFHKPIFTSQFECMFQLRTADAIVACMSLALRILTTKGGLQTWRNIRFKA
jgi:hypothetical protein